MAGGVGSEGGGALERGGGDDDAAAAAGAAGGFLQVGRDRGVGAGGGGRAVPGLPVGVVGEDLGQRGVRGVPGGHVSGLVDRRADQRVPEPQDLIVGFDEVGLDGGDEVGDRRLGARDEAGGLHDLGRRAAVVGRRQQQQRLDDRVELGRAGGERLLQPLGQRQPARHRRAGPRSGVERGGQLDQGQRVASRLGRDPPAVLADARRGCRACEQVPGRAAR